tara:strand:+ start:2901 stop:3095 length:195 start_codon:yes stop_codon:yes gene_type:complete
MTAIQILEKLGADASFHPSKLTDNDKREIEKLSAQQPGFHAPLVHAPATEDEEETEPQDDNEEK